MKPHIVFRLLLLAFGFGPAAEMHATGEYFKVEYPPSTAAGSLQIGVTYTVWVPDGVKTLRGIIVHQHGAGITASEAGASAAYDLQWQALAKKWDCALMGPSYHVQTEATDISAGGSELWFDPRRGSDKAFQKALVDLGKSSGHGEMSTVPWCLWGHSGGGIWANVMATLHPNRILALFLRSGNADSMRGRSEFTPPKIPNYPFSMYGIPILLDVGQQEKPAEGKANGAWTGSVEMFHEYRSNGAPIAFAADPLTGHACGNSRDLAIPFFDACLAMRLPDKGASDQSPSFVDLGDEWLAPMFGTKAVASADYKDEPHEAVWLPNAAVAKAWMEYVSGGPVSDVTPPPAPFAVKAAAKGDQGVEVTWDAEADLESGIGAFIVLRDGREVGKLSPVVSEKSMGRPLFQGLSFHDTPVGTEGYKGPLPQMRFVDPSAKTGERHSYTVIEVNGAGLKSIPSDPTSIL